MALRDQKGSVLVLVAFGFIAVATLGGIYLAFFSGSEPKRGLASDPGLVMAELQDKVERALTSQAAIDASVARNTNQFSCLYSVSGSCRGQGGIFLLYETGSPAAQPVSQLMQGAGVTQDGVGCTSFPSEECPFRVEAWWKPVCAPGNCDNTKSFRVKARVYYQPDASVAARFWEKDGMFTPAVKLSQSVSCQRGGGIWMGTECVTPEQARQIASSNREPPRAGVSAAMASASAREQDARAQEEIPSEPVPDAVPQYVCPESIVVQGEFYAVEHIGPGRGQVRVPAVNGCPAEDVFVFQCTPKNPPEFEGEGQWIQTEGVMAPPCDENGHPLGDGARF